MVFGAGQCPDLPAAGLWRSLSLDSWQRTKVKQHSGDQGGVLSAEQIALTSQTHTPLKTSHQSRQKRYLPLLTSHPELGFKRLAGHQQFIHNPQCAASLRRHTPAALVPISGQSLCCPRYRGTYNCLAWSLAPPGQDYLSGHFKISIPLPHRPPTPVLPHINNSSLSPVPSATSTTHFNLDSLSFTLNQHIPHHLQ